MKLNYFYNSMRIKSKIIIFTTFILLITMTLLSVVIHNSVSNELFKTVEASAQNLIRATWNQVKSQYNGFLYFKETILRDNKADVKYKMDLVFRVLNSSLSKNDRFYTLNQVTSYSKIVCIYDLNENRIISKYRISEEIIQNIIANSNSESLSILEVKKSRYASKLFVKYNWLIIIDIGISNINYELDKKLDAIITELNEIIITQKISESDYIFIFDKEYNMLVHPNLAGTNGYNLINPVTNKRILVELKGAYDSGDRMMEYLWDRPENREEYRFRKKVYLSYFEPLGWYICISVYKADIEKSIFRVTKNIFILFSIFLIIAIFISSMVSERIVNPLKILTENVKNVDKDGIPIDIQKISGSREFIILSETLKKMTIETRRSRNNLKRRTEELEDYKNKLEDLVNERTKELKLSYQNLKNTQEQLFESEKLASLGGLVAGIAHEMNTPIGIAITASSHLEILSTDLLNDIITGGIKKSKFESNIKDLFDSSLLISNNLKKAGDLILNFKEIAVDQSTQDFRRFNISQYLRSILSSLEEKIKGLEVIVDCNEDLMIYSSPGTISQIISNLIMNSIIHGFDSKDNGIIKISISEKNEQYIIDYSDNGKGIDSKFLKSVFDPFYTTRRGQGGAGLGMHIVYNLVTIKLRGNIKCISELEKGAEFIITMPQL